MCVIPNLIVPCVHIIIIIIMCVIPNLIVPSVHIIIIISATNIFSGKNNCTGLFISMYLLHISPPPINFQSNSGMWKTSLLQLVRAVACYMYMFVTSHLYFVLSAHDWGTGLGHIKYIIIFYTSSEESIYRYIIYRIILITGVYCNLFCIYNFGVLCIGLLAHTIIT